MQTKSEAGTDTDRERENELDKEKRQKEAERVRKLETMQRGLSCSKPRKGDGKRDSPWGREVRLWKAH